MFKATPCLFAILINFDFIVDVSAEASELIDLLSPTARFLAAKGDTDLVDVTASDSRSIVEAAKSIGDVVLAIPRKIIKVIKRIFTAIYAYWALIFSTIYKFYSSVFAVIGNTGGGIVNFYKELFSIFIGIFI